jgi:hypothetical protein
MLKERLLGGLWEIRAFLAFKKRSKLVADMSRRPEEGLQKKAGRTISSRELHQGKIYQREKELLFPEIF